MEEEKKKVQKRTIESREKIVKAALLLFSQKGYYNTNTKEIAKTAGISVGNFYNYYKDKGELYYELAKVYSEGSYAALAELCSNMVESGNPKGAFENYVYTQMDRAGETGLLFKDCTLLIQQDEKLRKLFEGQTDKTISMIEDMLKQVAGERLKGKYYVTARLLYVVVDQTTQDILRVKGTDYYKTYQKEFVHMIQQYLFD